MNTPTNDNAGECSPASPCSHFMETPQREMTLDEYMGQLPESHLARQQLAGLRQCVKKYRPLHGPVNDPDDYGSREFWKAANSHAVKRWAEEADKAAKLQHLVEWAESIICNALPISHWTQSEWNAVVKQWRDLLHANNAISEAHEK